MDGEDLLRMKPREIKRLHLIRQALEEKDQSKASGRSGGFEPATDAAADETS